MNMKKLILTNLPYLLFVYPFDKAAQAFYLDTLCITIGLIIHKFIK